MMTIGGCGYNNSEWRSWLWQCSVEMLATMVVSEDVSYDGGNEGVAMMAMSGGVGYHGIEWMY